ncbi:MULTISPECIES: CBS domain-containing protein [Aeromonas]|uniref:CBS domain-containing protein n=1 Tax=Aeromonas TaxID=642 RepID=UPI001C2430BD|nr:MULTISPECIES: CBS domain-containing protein [Aeromonas]QXC35641.1 CBS domain-containing protein [Aeromonas sp. FDAARGOS 1407]UAK71686.1 CBS domain-containing protein [Aeromonas enteropelogenes]
MLHIRDIMTTRVATVSMDDRLGVIKDIFEQAHFRHLLVLEEEELVGVISDRDLFRAISPYLDSEAEMSRDTETLNRRAHQIMSRQLVTIAPNLPLRDGIKLMLEKNVSCLPVLENGALVGIISWKDFLKTVLDHDSLG